MQPLEPKFPENGLTVCGSSYSMWPTGPFQLDNYRAINEAFLQENVSLHASETVPKPLIQNFTVTDVLFLALSE